MNGVARELDMTVSDFQAGVGYRLNYSEGLKRATEIKVEARTHGAELSIKDWYHAVEDNPDEAPELREARIAEADRSAVDVHLVVARPDMRQVGAGAQAGAGRVGADHRPRRDAAAGRAFDAADTTGQQ